MKDGRIIHSFDVFDTLITRAVGDSSCVFLLLGNLLAKSGIIRVSPEIFARSRWKANVASLNRNDDRETTLSAIYKQLANMLDLTDEECAQIRRLEEETEERLSRPIKSQIAYAQELQVSGQTVIAISDMYLSRERISRLLLNAGVGMPDEQIFVSSEYRSTKRSGKLFRVVENSLLLSGDSFHHIGDNMTADVKQPSRFGWKARRFESAVPNRYEEAMTSFKWESGGLSSVFAGASRLTRLDISHSGEKSNDIVNVASGVFAPIFAAYVLWILKKSKLLGIKRLYFVSRDGEIFLRIAERLNTKLKLGIDLRYFYGSRKAWEFPSISDLETYLGSAIPKERGTKAKLQNYLANECFSVTDLLSRMRMDPIDYLDILCDAGFSQDQWTDNLDSSQIAKLRKLVLSPPFSVDFNLRVEEARELVLAYCDEQGLLETCDWALVDLGWKGSPQTFLSNLLSSIGSKVPRGFYLVMRSSKQDEGAGIKDGYLANVADGTGYARLTSEDNLFWGLLESICTANHGSVLGYEREGKIRPILAEQFAYSKNESVQNVVRQVCEKFVDNLTLDADLVDWTSNLLPMSARLLDLFLTEPCKSEVVALSSVVLEDNNWKTKFIPIARAYTIGTLPYVLKRGSYALPLHSPWAEGGLALNSRPMAKLVTTAARLGGLAKRFRSKK